jgi:hypothetical protein
MLSADGYNQTLGNTHLQGMPSQGFPVHMMRPQESTGSYLNSSTSSEDEGDTLAHQDHHRVTDSRRPELSPSSYTSSPDSQMVGRGLDGTDFSADQVSKMMMNVQAHVR